MTKVSADVVKDFEHFTPAQRQDLLLKLQRYVDRGRWAEDILARLAAAYGLAGTLPGPGEGGPRPAVSHKT